MNTVKIANIQIETAANKASNFAQVEHYLDKLAHDNVDIVSLPEMFLCPYQNNKFKEYAEPEGGESWQKCAQLAQEHKIYLVAGTMPEIDDEHKIYNTAYVFNKNGEQIAKYRKMHLFDIDIIGKQTFKESDTLTAGNEIITFDTEWCRIGLAICYDLRFPELFKLLIEQQCQVIIVPGAFNLTTGPAHWELLFRSRAVDNQVFMVGTSSASDQSANYTAYGHSIIVSPWGDVIEQLGFESGYSSQTLNLDEVVKFRREVPLKNHKRNDVYRLIQQ